MKTYDVTLVAAVCVAACLSSAGGGTMKDGPATAFVFGDNVEDEGFGFGYQATYEFHRNFSIEFSGLWHEDESTKIGRAIPGLTAISKVDLDVISLALTGRASLEPNPSTLVYGGAGFGYYIIEAKNADIHEGLSGTGIGFAEVDGDKEFGAHIVIGTEVVLTHNWEVFAEFRQVFLNSGFTVRFSPDSASPVDDQRDSLSYDHRMLRIGLNYRF